MADDPSNKSIHKLPHAMAIEFPLKVTNGARALDMIGGGAAISNATAAHAASQEDQPSSNIKGRKPEASTLELRLRSGDRHCHPITGRSVYPESGEVIILELKLPQAALDAANGNIQTALKLAGPSNWTARPRLAASQCIRFREMADFQYNTEDSKLLQRLKTSILAGSELKTISSFELNATGSEESPDLAPPPRFSQQTQPFFYNYAQSAALHIVDDADGSKSLSRGPNADQSRVISHMLTWGDPIPEGPPTELPVTPKAAIKSCIEELHKLFAKRPSYTRKALQALISPDNSRALRYALPYVSYFYRSGPWRGAYICYGSSPTQDSSWSRYQMEYFRIRDNDSSDVAESEIIYTFDGVHFPTARSLQLCDITEKYLVSYIESQKSLRKSIDSKSGWFTTEALAIIRGVLRAELVNALAGRSPLTRERLEDIRDDVVIKVAKASGSITDSSPEDSGSEGVEEFYESD